MKLIKNIVTTMVVLLLAYILLIVAIPALAIGGLGIALFGPVVLYILAAVAIIAIIVSIVKKKD